MDATERENTEALLLKLLSERIESKLNPIETGNDDHKTSLKDLKEQIESIESIGKAIEEKLKQALAVSSATTESTQASPQKGTKAIAKRPTARDMGKMDKLKVKDDNHIPSDTSNSLISPKVGATGGKMKRAVSAAHLGGPSGALKPITKAEIKESLINAAKKSTKTKGMETINEEGGKNNVVKALPLSKKTEDKKEGLKSGKAGASKAKKEDLNQTGVEEEKVDGEKKEKPTKTAKPEKKKEAKKGAKGGHAETDEASKDKPSTGKADTDRSNKGSKKKNGDQKDEEKAEGKKGDEKPEGKKGEKKGEKKKGEKKTAEDKKAGDDKKKEEKPGKKGAKEDAKKDSKKTDKKKKGEANKTEEIPAEENKEPKIEEPKPVVEEEKVEPEEPKKIEPENNEQTIKETKVEPEVKEEQNGHIGEPEKAKEEEGGAGVYEKVVEELNKIIGKDIREKANDHNQLGKYIKDKIESYEIKVANLSYENEQIKQNIPDDKFDMKPYAMKTATKEIIEFNEIEWVTELFDKTEPTEDLVWLVSLYLTILEDNEIPSTKDTKEFWNYAGQYFKAKLDNLNDVLMGTAEKVDNLPRMKKLRLKKLMKGKTAMLNPNSYDSVPFCMVISILTKEVCEHLGILSNDVSKKNNPSHIYHFNKERCDFYNQKIGELTDLGKKYNLA